MEDVGVGFLGGPADTDSDDKRVFSPFAVRFSSSRMR